MAVGFGALISLGVAFLVIGDRWAKRAPTGHGDFFPTLHVVAIVAAVLGVVVVWMSFATDHPKKWLHLTIPFVFVAIVYGYALGLNRDAWMYLLRDIRDRVTRRNAV